LAGSPTTFNISPTNLFYELTDPNSVFGQPVVDGQGRLLVGRSIWSSNCGFGFCEMRLQSIGSDGLLNWETPGLPDADSIAAKAVFLGLSDRAHALGRTTIYAFDPDGSSSVGWPVQLQPYYNWTFTGLTLDMMSGRVFSSLGVFGQCFNSCDKVVVATDSDGSEKWRTYFLGDGTSYGIARGPAGRIFTLTEYISFPTSATLVALDPDSGVEKCRTSAVAFFGSFFGTDQAVFASFRGDVTAYDADCRPTLLYSSSATNVVLQGTAGNVAIGLEYPSNVSGTVAAQLVGFSYDGSVSWRNRRIQLTASDSALRASRGSTAYVTGGDADDGGRRKVFAVDVRAGDVQRAISTDGLCTSCGVAVAPNGTLYINDLNSTRIYKVN
jgi:hypothetical protein